jgi:hypothetical protein
LGTPDFKSLFCELHGYAPDQYEERAFRACLYWHARLLAPLIRALAPKYFERDFALINYLASAPGRRHAMNELAAFMEANESKGGFARKVLRIRISARKTSAILGQLFARRPNAKSGDTTVT